MLLMRISPDGIGRILTDAKDPEESLAASAFWKILVDSGVLARFEASIREAINSVPMPEEENSEVGELVS